MGFQSTRSKARSAAAKLKSREEAMKEVEKRRAALMRGALTTATSSHNIGGVARKHTRPKPVTLPAVNLKDFDE
jgi:hypothetical protein